MTGCRAGAVLDGPALCGNPVLSRAEADALGLTPKWCAVHAEPLARVKAYMRGRKFKPVAIKPRRAEVDLHPRVAACRSQFVRSRSRGTSTPTATSRGPRAQR